MPLYASPKNLQVGDLVVFISSDVHDYEEFGVTYESDYCRVMLGEVSEVVMYDDDMEEECGISEEELGQSIQVDVWGASCYYVHSYGGDFEGLYEDELFQFIFLEEVVGIVRGLRDRRDRDGIAAYLREFIKMHRSDLLEYLQEVEYLNHLHTEYCEEIQPANDI
jgi:hypothetical protein